MLVYKKRFLKRNSSPVKWSAYKYVKNWQLIRLQHLYCCVRYFRWQLWPVPTLTVFWRWLVPQLTLHPTRLGHVLKGEYLFSQIKAHGSWESDHNIHKLLTATYLALKFKLLYAKLNSWYHPSARSANLSDLPHDAASTNCLAFMVLARFLTPAWIGRDNFRTSHKKVSYRLQLICAICKQRIICR